MMRKRLAFCLAVTGLIAAQSGMAAPVGEPSTSDQYYAVTPEGREIIVQPVYTVERDYVVVEYPRGAREQAPQGLTAWPPSDDLVGQRPVPAQERYFAEHEAATGTASCGLAFDEQPTYCPKG